MDTTINSSDPIEPDDEPPQSITTSRPRIGERMKKRIFENQAEDRPLSKKNARGVKFASAAAPGTLDHQLRIEQYWDSFYKSIGHK
jgi:hypothetical protein